MGQDTLETIIFERKDGIAYVTLNRPKVMNALSRQTIAELHTTFMAIRDDLGTKGVILTGTGEKAFIAGADIAELAKATALEAERQAHAGQTLLNLIEDLGKPVVAAINGVAFGGGCETALACTIRLCVPSARFGQPEIKLGLIPGFGGTQRLARLVGKGRALQMILTGEPVAAEEARRIGLVNEVVEPTQLVARAETLLRQIAANAPLAVGYAIKAVNVGLDGPICAGLMIERSYFGLCSATHDKQEGVAAFLEKRAARFQGQ